MFHKLQSVMSAAGSGHSKIPKGNGSYPVGCTDLMFGYGNEVRPQSPFSFNPKGLPLLSSTGGSVTLQSPEND